jgi:hypothetical protein
MNNLHFGEFLIKKINGEINTNGTHNTLECMKLLNSYLKLGEILVCQRRLTYLKLQYYLKLFNEFKGNIFN